MSELERGYEVDSRCVQRAWISQVSAVRPLPGQEIFNVDVDDVFRNFHLDIATLRMPFQLD